MVTCIQSTIVSVIIKRQYAHNGSEKKKVIANWSEREKGFMEETDEPRLREWLVMGDAYTLFTVKGKTRLGRNYIRKSQGIRGESCKGQYAR